MASVSSIKMFSKVALISLFNVLFSTDLVADSSVQVGAINFSTGAYCDHSTQQAGGPGGWALFGAGQCNINANYPSSSSYATIPTSYQQSNSGSVQSLTVTGGSLQSLTVQVNPNGLPVVG